jgi:hypothetical protein
MKKIVVAALLAVGIIGGSLPSVAAAAASSGAIKIADQHCHTEPDGFTTCFAVAGVATETSTPSGNTSYTGHMKTAFTAYDAAGTLLATSTGRNHAVRLFKAGDEDVHVLAERFNSTTTLADGSACTYTYTMQYVHGEIRFHTVEHVCN